MSTKNTILSYFPRTVGEVIPTLGILYKLLNVDKGISLISNTFEKHLGDNAKNVDGKVAMGLSHFRKLLSRIPNPWLTIDKSRLFVQYLSCKDPEVFMGELTHNEKEALLTVFSRLQMMMGNGEVANLSRARDEGGVIREVSTLTEEEEERCNSFNDLYGIFYPNELNEVKKEQAKLNTYNLGMRD